MVRNSLAAALWLLVGLLASFLGALNALVHTGAGRNLLTRVAMGAVGNAVDGRVEIGDVGGPLITGITLRNVRIFDLDTTLVAALPRVDATYNPFDLAGGRVVLLTLALRQPVINIVQRSNGRMNFEEVLGLGRPSVGPKRPPKLVLFRNVRIEEGTITLRLQDRSAGDVAGQEITTIEASRPMVNAIGIDQRVAAPRLVTWRTTLPPVSASTLPRPSTMAFEVTSVAL